jgi:hypothetical protein
MSDQISTIAGDACPKHGVFRNQSVDPRYQRDNQRVFLRRIK